MSARHSLAQSFPESGPGASFGDSISAGFAPYVVAALVVCAVVLALIVYLVARKR